MPKANFTAKWIDALPSPSRGQVDYFDTNRLRESCYFGIRTSYGGRKSWFVVYRQNGKLKRLTLDRGYPALSLKDARDEALRQASRIINGVDVAGAKQELRRAPTVRDLGSLYLEKWAKPRKKSWREDDRILRVYVLPKIGDQKIHAVQRRDLVDLVDEIANKTPIQANRVLACLRKMFNFALERELIEFNPCARVKPPAGERARDRVLTPEEVRGFWNSLKKTTIAWQIQLALKLMLVTGQRKGEVIGAEWEEVDLEERVWTIPARRAKNKLAHRVPLSAVAVALLKEAKDTRKTGSDFVFPGRGTDGALLATSVDHAVRDNRQSFIAGEGAGAKTIPHFTPHDLRRTAASFMASAGISRLVIKRVLNHVDKDITAVYDRHSYDREKRAALNVWARQLTRIISGGQSKLRRRTKRTGG